MTSQPQPHLRAEPPGGCLEALPNSERALWATAMYAGLRRGELQALTDDLVDLDANVIHVQ